MSVTPRPSRRRARSMLLVIVAVSVTAAAVVAITLMANRGPLDDRSAAVATPNIAAIETAPSQKKIDELVARLASGDASKVAQALELEKSELDRQFVDSFSKLKIDFERSSAVEFDSGWTIYATVTDASGARSRWKVVLLDSSSGLTILDSEQQDGGG